MSSKLFLLAFFFTFILGILIRIYNLEGLPISQDEAIYLLTTRKIRISSLDDWKLSFQGSMQKPPFIFLMVAPFLRGDDNDLIRARLFSVFFGGLTGLAAFLLALKLLGRKEGILVLSLFSFSPFLIFYQRLFLLESFLLFFIFLTILILEYSIKSQGIHFKVILIALGYLLVGIKQSFFLWLPTILLFPFISKDVIKLKKLLTNFLYVICGIFLGIIFFYLLVGLDVYFIPKKQFVSNFFNWNMVTNNLVAAIVWTKSYLTNLGFFIAIGIISISILIKKLKGSGSKSVIILGIILLPVFLQIIIAKYFFARYILPSFSLGLIFFVNELSFISKKFNIVWASIFFILIIRFLLFDLQILQVSSMDGLHKNERWQFISGWPSGWGVKEISNIIDEDKNKDIKTIASIGIGMMPANGLRFYLDKKNIEISEYPKEIHPELIKENYLVFQTDNENIYLPPVNYKEVISIAKPGNETKISLYKKN